MGWLAPLWHWLEVHTGTVNEAGPYYGFWSGFGSDIAEFAIFGSLIGLYHHHNCTVKGCFRIGKHPVDGTPYKTCHRHATITQHQALIDQHKEKFPEQHELLSRK